VLVAVVHLGAQTRGAERDAGDEHVLEGGVVAGGVKRGYAVLGVGVGAVLEPLLDRLLKLLGSLGELLRSLSNLGSGLRRGSNLSLLVHELCNSTVCSGSGNSGTSNNSDRFLREVTHYLNRDENIIYSET
jgi:hypothetical protein